MTSVGGIPQKAQPGSNTVYSKKDESCKLVQTTSSINCKHEHISAGSVMKNENAL